MIDIKQKPFLNLGCGANIHKEWTNVDFGSQSCDVLNIDLTGTLPFHDNAAKYIYHSHLLEHFNRSDATHFLKECYRVLEKGGIMRIVVPDMQNIAHEYLRSLAAFDKEPNHINMLKVEWNLIEMIDQASRNIPGGEMKKFVASEGEHIRDYIIERIGYVGTELFASIHLSNESAKIRKKPRVAALVRRAIKRLLRKNIVNEHQKIGVFRKSGEVHYWMYDAPQLTYILKETGFTSIYLCDAHSSQIENWGAYNLDVKEGIPLHNSSLYIEAIK